MLEKTQQQSLKTKMLSQQLDKEIQKLNAQSTQNNQQPTNTMTQFDLLEQKLRRLQQKLQKVKESDSRHIYRQMKNSSSNNSQVSTNRNHQNDAKARLNYESAKKNRNQKVQASSVQNTEGKRKSFTVKKDQIIESKITNNSKRKNFQSEKKPVFSQQQIKGKKTRIISAKIQSKKSSKVNSKLNTPQKNKRTIVSSKNKIQNFQSIEQNQQVLHAQVEMKRRSSKKKADQTAKKDKFGSESQMGSNFKMLSKNIMNTASQAKLKKKSLTSMSQNNILLTSNKKSNPADKPLQSIRTQQKSHNNNYMTNLSAKAIKNNLSLTQINNDFIAFSRQPMVLLKEKKKVEKELKEKSRENLKLKDQLSKLQKYEDEYNRMREIFERFEREKRQYKSRH